MEGHLGLGRAELLRLLNIQAVPCEVDRFVGQHTQMSATINHVFGGLVTAQALIAAGRTVTDDRRVHSLHAYFLRRGDHQLPLEIAVSRTRDGRAVSHRRMVVSQAGRDIAEFSTSWAVPAEGPEHQVKVVEAVDPETLRPDHEVFTEIGYPHPVAAVIDGFELRTVDLLSMTSDDYRLWFRLDGSGGDEARVDDPLINAALLAFSTDLRVLQPLLRRHRGSPIESATARWNPTTLDHTIWFHEQFWADDWHIQTGDSPWAGNGRGLAHAHIRDAGGRLIASVAQEAVLRRR